LKHELKILPIYFEQIKSGVKNFELRKKASYKIGDVLLLKEHNEVNYTGREIQKTIKYILENVPQYGLKKKYVILGLNE
tara:strand:+ start:3621 stop:3857 length:237 start_codon:yes stop_codon:yes gene_type:complete